MSQIAKKKFEILEYTQDVNFSMNGLADKLNELTSLIIEDLNDSLPYNRRMLSIKTLLRIHPKLSTVEASSLLEFARSKTITHEECYGNGSIIFPQWIQFNER